ncbi:MAG: efflux RND transporter permease subunit [Gemmatimonadales bacterium]
MLNALIAGALRHRAVVLVGAVLLLLAGGWSASRMPVDVFPDLTAPTVTVLAEAHGMAPEEIETLVTMPIETAMNGATGVRRVRSSTARGISVIWVEFDWGTDILRDRQVVAERLQTVTSTLPDGVAMPQLAPVSSVMGEVLMIGLTGGANEMELRDAADWVVRRRLLAVPGVAQVIPIGGEVREYQVLIDIDRMQATGASLHDVLETAAAASRSASGGIYVDRGQEVAIRGLGRARTTEDLGAAVVRVEDGVPILLRDVATVQVGPAPRLGTGSVDGTPGVVLSIQKQPGTSTLELTDAITAELAAIRTALPDDITIHQDLFRQADFIDVAIGNMLEALRDGAVLVVVVLFLFLWNFRTTLISLSAIPLSLVVALLTLQALGISINTMTLGGLAIAIGALVDDAIIDVENVYRRLRENRQLPESERRTAIDIVFTASIEIRASIVNATLVIAVVFLPLFFLSGVEGRLLRPLGIAYVVALAASLAVAVTVTPVLCALLLPNSAGVLENREGRLLTILRRWYGEVLARIIARPRPVLVAALALFIVAAAAVPFLGSAFLPEFNEGALTVNFVTVPGTSLPEADAMGRRVEQILLEQPEVVHTDRRQGRAELDEHAQGSNAAEIDVVLTPGADRDALNERLRDAFTTLPGTNITIGQPIGHRIDHLLSGTRANLAVKLFGPDLYELRRVGGQIRDAMATVNGVVDLQLEQQADVPQLRITPNRMNMAQAGVTPGYLAEVIDAAFGGESVGQVIDEGRRWEIVVRLPEAARTGIDAVGRLPVVTPAGMRVPLNQLAMVELLRGPNTISREQVQRKIVIQANVAGRDLGSTVEEVQQQVAALVTLPPGYRVEYGGQFESRAAAARTIALLSLAAVSVVLLILFTEFGSFRTALIAMINLPLSLIGGVAAVLLTDGIVSIASLVGFVTLFGIATRNGILLLSHYQALMGEGMSFDVAIRRGSEERLAPILMTALTAGLALVPLAMAAGEPGSELQAPLAVVILGGLLTATALNMIVLPATYAWLGERRSGLRAKA